jgi:hypothetical protein
LHRLAEILFATSLFFSFDLEIAFANVVVEMLIHSILAQRMMSLKFWRKKVFRGGFIFMFWLILHLIREHFIKQSLRLEA